MGDLLEEVLARGGSSVSQLGRDLANLLLGA